MTPKEFFYKVKDMRAAQCEYFKSRSPFALRRSRQLEAEIDREIKRTEQIKAEQERERLMPPLFDFDDND